MEVRETIDRERLVGKDASAIAVGLLGELERSRRRVAFEQYEAIAELLRLRVCERIECGVPQDRWEAGIASEVGQALQISPHAAARTIGRTKALHRNLPATLARLGAGELSPEAVTEIVRGLSHLDDALQQQADAELSGEAFAAAGLGPRRLHDLVQRTAYELDREATLERIAHAEKDRHVSIRPATDCMARVSILLPLVQAVSVFASLTEGARGIVGIGEETRNRAQVMADLAYERITGVGADQPQPVTVHLTVSDQVLLGDQPGTGHLSGGGEVPAEIARNLVGRAGAKAQAWVRRLYVRPEAGAVIGLDSGNRIFPDGLAAVIAARDRYCRTPYCDALIAHTDHVVAHARGGATTVENGQGLCAACNYAKEAPGWSARTVSDPSGRHTVETRTPAGVTYRSTAPRIA